MTTTDTPDDLIPHKRVLAPLFAAFPVELRNVPRGEARVMVTVYARALQDLALPLLGAAVDRLVATRERLPSPAAVRKTAVELQHGPKRPGGEAWGDVVKAMKRYGARRTPGVDFTFDDPLVAKATESLSWTDLCLSENSVADRARFIELYDQLRDGERAAAQIAAGATSAMLPRAREAQSLGRTIAGLLPTAAVAADVIDVDADDDAGDEGGEVP